MDNILVPSIQSNKSLFQPILSSLTMKIPLLMGLSSKYSLQFLAIHVYIYVPSLSCNWAHCPE